MKSKIKIPDFIYFATFLLIVISIWQFSADNKIINEFHFSSPSAIGKDFVELFGSGEIWIHMAMTFGVSLLGLIYGIISGVAVAFLFGNFSFMAKMFDPILVGLNGLPKLALGPLFIIWFGIGIESKIFMSTITVFFIVFFNAYAGFKNVDINLVNTLKLMGASKLQILRKVTLPSCIPWITASLRAGAGGAVMGTIVGEYLGSSKGLGWMVQYAGGIYNITRVLSVVFILLVAMSATDAFLKWFEARILSWRQENI